MLRNGEVNKESHCIHMKCVLPYGVTTTTNIRRFFTGESLLSHSHLLVCCPIRDSTEAETAVSCSDLSNSMWGALVRHGQEGWREEETWGERGGGGEGDKQEGDVKRWRVSECVGK